MPTHSHLHILYSLQTSLLLSRSTSSASSWNTADGFELAFPAVDVEMMEVGSDSSGVASMTQSPEAVNSKPLARRNAGESAVAPLQETSPSAAPAESMGRRVPLEEVEQTIADEQESADANPSRTHDKVGYPIKILGMGRACSALNIETRSQSEF
jgi:hypothetical protein